MEHIPLFITALFVGILIGLLKRSIKRRRKMNPPSSKVFLYPDGFKKSLLPKFYELRRMAKWVFRYRGKIDKKSLNDGDSKKK